MSLFVLVQVDAILGLELVNLTLLCILIHLLERLQTWWGRERHGQGEERRERLRWPGEKEE